ncbi:MAG: glycoside hydrolase family 3 C-terminal domain-containing protein [Oscillospiraceae bacterium]|nr:glycoside hydrolase family 3 C-terminal domain-containing protein [Oscillospiraceae bacterium]
MRKIKRIMPLILSLALIASTAVIAPIQTAMMADYPLSIMEPPVSQNVLANSDVTFYVVMLGGEEPYSFQWQSGANESGPWVNVTSGGSGYTSETLTLTSVTTGMSGTWYRCVITDSDTPPATIESLAARLQVTSGTTRTAAPTASYNSGTTASSNIIGINAAITLATTATVANNPKIYYTTGATAAETPDPTLASKVFDYSECIQAPATPGTFCVKAIATSTNAATSTVAIFTYTVTNDRQRLSDIKSDPDFLAWKAGNFLGEMPKVVADKIDAVIDRMSLTERARFTVGDGSSYGTGRVPGTAGHTIAMIDFGIPQTSFSDGPAGLRITTGSTTGTYLRRPTYWPNGSARSATWNKDLVYEMGSAWGAECYYFSSDVQLAPGMNIHRSVLNGRNFEYYSEDPMLSGRTAAMEVSGFQENNPVGMMIKHFAVNNQETNRSNKPTAVETRTLREIYLRNFEYAVEEGKPWAIMNSYNQVNGVSSAQNFGLNTVIAKGEWGFKGFLCTDWGSGTGGYGNAGDLYSVYNAAGLTTTTTGSLTANNSSRLASGNDTLQYASADNAGITSSVTNATHPLTQARVDQAVRLLLTMVVKGPAFNNKPLIFGNTDQEVMDKNRALGLEIGDESIILLKNGTVNGKPALPLAVPTAPQQVLLLGSTMNTLINGGTGSGAVNLASGESIPQLAASIQNIVGGSARIINSNGLTGVTTTNGENVITQSLFDSTWNTGNISAVVYAYRRTSAEGSDQSATGSPGSSMTGYQNSAQETNIINQASAFAKAHNIPFIVMLNMGTWTTISTWADKADGIIMCWEQGMGGGVPMARALFGLSNPSGKTPTSVPYAISGNASNGQRYNPTEGQFAISGTTVVYYHEGIYVGYRYYDTFNVPVAFPFGHGLSYTSFKYSNAKLSKTTFDGVNDKLTASVTITNTGKVAGKEVVEFYIGAPGVQMRKPVKELKGYEKTKLLEPGESQTITVEFNAESLMSYADAAVTVGGSGVAGDWLVESGHYVVYFASTSQDIRATKSFTIDAGFLVKHVAETAMSPTSAYQTTLAANRRLPTQITVSFVPGGGLANFQKAYSVMGSAYNYLPVCPIDGIAWEWYTTSDLTTKVTEATLVPSAATTLYAKWVMPAIELVVAGDKATASASVYHDSATPVNATLIIAVYDAAGRMLSTTSDNVVAVAANTPTAISVSIPVSGTAASVKAFLWESDTYIPLVENAVVVI